MGAVSVKGTGIAQSVEALYFTTELHVHTSSVKDRVQPGTKYLYNLELHIFTLVKTLVNLAI